MGATIKGIYHNLLESKYCISNGDIQYFFSSRLYMEKFLNGYKENRLKMSKRSQKMDLGLDFTALHDVLFYRSIEKRGFRITLKGDNLTWLNVQKYVLRRMIEPNTSDYVETQPLKLGERLKSLESTCHKKLDFREELIHFPQDKNSTTGKTR